MKVCDFRVSLTLLAGWKCWGLHALGHGLEATIDGSRCINVPHTCPSSSTILACSTLSVGVTELVLSGHLIAGSHAGTFLFFPVLLSHFPSGACWDHLPDKVLALKSLSSRLFLGKSKQDTGVRFPLTKSSL